MGLEIDDVTAIELYIRLDERSLGAFKLINKPISNTFLALSHEPETWRRRLQYHLSQPDIFMIGSLIDWKRRYTIVIHSGVNALLYSDSPNDVSFAIKMGANIID